MHLNNCPSSNFNSDCHAFSLTWLLGSINIPQIEFNAYIVPTNELSNRIFRLLDVDNRTILPYKIHILVLISSRDVLHAWTFPSLGVKADAVPGCLNQAKFFAQHAVICLVNALRFVALTIDLYTVLWLSSCFTRLRKRKEK